MLNPYQQLLWIWIGNQFYFYVFSFKIRKRNIGSMDSGLSYICYSKKKARVTYSLQEYLKVPSFRDLW